MHCVNLFIKENEKDGESELHSELYYAMQTVCQVSLLLPPTDEETDVALPTYITLSI